jgi:radical SAM superfamily enzyme YgiQ (UPF0313 family)
MKIGVLELIAYTVPQEWSRRWAGQAVRKHLYSIMPQVVAAWCRRLKHEVHYATYYGQADPTRLLPDDLDIVFLSAATQASALAYALAKLYRQAGTRTVLGGPHAKSFPVDAVRFFDIVVGECDEELVATIVKGDIDPPAYVSSARRPRFLPGVEERMPELIAAGFRPDRRVRLNVVALLGSQGCPFRCDFCTEWNAAFTPLPKEGLAEDLRFLARKHPGALVAFHDPNFAIRFDETMELIEGVGATRPNRYLMECSLSVLRPDRLARLRRTGCIAIAPGVESWFDYGDKLGMRAQSGRDKLEHVIELHRYVPGLQANFLFGTDQDRGSEPADATIEFISRLPFVWPNVNIPTPYGGTPMFERALAEGRILRSMPLSFYCAPYLVMQPRHYDPISYYRHLLRIHEACTSWSILVRRVGSSGPAPVRLVHLLQTLAHRDQLAETRRILHALETDRAFRAFHDGSSKRLPEFYHHRFEQRLGPFTSLIAGSERAAVLDQLAVALGSQTKYP